MLRPNILGATRQTHAHPVAPRAEVEVLTGHPEEDGTRPLGSLGPGEYFGDMALLKRSLRTASVRSRTYCDLFFIKSHPLHALLIDYANDKKQIEINAMKFFSKDGGS